MTPPNTPTAAGTKVYLALPLRFDLIAQNLYDANGLALARFRLSSTGADVERICNSHASLLSHNARLVAALVMLYDKWENGTPCYQDADVNCDSLGNAFKLTDEEETRVLEALEAAGIKTALASKGAA